MWSPWQVHSRQPYSENLYEHKYGKFAYRGCSERHRSYRKTYAYNKVSYGSRCRKEEAARHALAIEHEEKGHKNESRPCFALQNDEQHGKEHDAGGFEEVAHVVERKTIGIHHFCHGQCCGAFGKLSRLEAHGSQTYP